MVWLASIFGPFLLILGLWMALYHENMKKIVTSLKSTPCVFSLSGMINLLMGLSILSFYREWSWDLQVLVTLLGWVYLIRGVVILFFPQLFTKIALSKGSWLRFRGVIAIVWGFALCWLAFMSM